MHALTSGDEIKQGSIDIEKRNSWSSTENYMKRTEDNKLKRNRFYTKN